MFSSANFLICTPEQHYIRFLYDSRHQQLQILKGHTEDYQLNIIQIKTRKKERKKSSDRFQSLFPTDITKSWNLDLDLAQTRLPCVIVINESPRYVTK